MTLADFARSIGISPATARQWKKREKIVERDGHFELIAEAQREWVGLPGRGASVIVGDLITDGSGVTSKVTGVTVDCDGGVTVRLKGPADSAQDSRLCRREDSNGGVGNPESHRESCAGCNALQERVTACERDNAILQRFIDGLRGRLSALEVSNEVLRHDQPILYREMRDRCATLEAENVNQQQYLVHLKGCVATLERDTEKLKKDARELYGVAGEHEERIDSLEGAPMARNGAESRPAIDPPGPSWGA